MGQTAGIKTTRPNFHGVSQKVGVLIEISLCDLQHAASVRGQRRIDLATDPPPELVIEIDVTSPSLDKFPIFAGLGIVEVWRYHGQASTVFRLQGATYKEQPASEVLLGVTGVILTQLVADSQRMKRTEWLREVRESIRPLHHVR
jgi:hypothetical protein